MQKGRCRCRSKDARLEGGRPATPSGTHNARYESKGRMRDARVLRGEISFAASTFVQF